MKTLVKRHLPTRVLNSWKTMQTGLTNTREALLDAKRHRVYGGPGEGSFDSSWTGRQLETQLTKDYHRVEKGLALREPKRPFGAEVEKRLRVGLSTLAAGTAGPITYGSFAESALTALQSWNAGGAADPRVALPVVRDDVLRQANSSEARTILFDDFFTSRRSIRDFDSSLNVDIADIEAAVALATNTPSVCNRQAFRVHMYTGKQAVTSVLSQQNGNAGFRNSIPVVLVVTVDARLFSGASERNQRWIDGGLFAMTLGWALHSRDLGTCFLNWSMKNSESDALRSSAGIAAHEDIVTLIAVGIPPKSFKVARSPRRQIDEVLVRHA
ncbi:nitroreductase family protein [Cryobacterium sp. CG_9.6]|uniref:nitroreductase family protein n=1 Tax=Cryobacterium sp. CG_9.6 TaxID=2760710 RepID=UPI0024742484|nr:nitroreductase family protein [Cryobacterium sp. CG_9.6]MDH6235376.1 nitroreductase [Cryobacterium sp. CG_9.6]